MAYLDKTALNYGNLWGMKASLHVDGNQFSWFASGVRQFKTSKPCESFTELYALKVLHQLPICSIPSGRVDAALSGASHSAVIRRPSIERSVADGDA